jgi:hypothetical protein
MGNRPADSSIVQTAVFFQFGAIFPVLFLQATPHRLSELVAALSKKRNFIRMQQTHLFLTA